MSVDLTSSRTLLGVIEQAKRPMQFLRNTFFRGGRPHDTETLDLSKITSNRKRPVGVNSAGQGVMVSRNGHTRYTVEPSYFRMRTKTTPADLLLTRANEALYGGMTPAARAAELVGEDIRDLMDLIDRAIEIQCSEALFTGVVKIYEQVEGGDPTNVRDVDFGYPGAHLVTLTDDDLWDDADSDPLDKLGEFADIIRNSGGMPPDILLMSQDLTSSFVHHTKVKNVLDNRRIMMGQLDPKSFPDRSNYIGNLSYDGFNVEVWTYSEIYEDFDGTVTNMVPAKKALLGSRRAPCELHYGVIQNLKAMRSGGSGAAKKFVGERFPLYYEQDDGSAAFYQLESAPLACNLQPENFVVFNGLA